MIKYFVNSALPSIEEVIRISDNDRVGKIICICKFKQNADLIAQILNADESGNVGSIPRLCLNIALLESTITYQYNPGYLSIDQLSHVRMAFDYIMHILEEQKLITKKDCMKLCSLNNKLYYKSIKRIADGVEKLYDRNES